MYEIGSSFFDVEQKSATLFLSGRMAQDYIVRDAIKQYGITSALLPSYCCHTMIEPFLRNDIPVRFFDVYYDGRLKMDLPSKKRDEVVLYLKYFGYEKIDGLDNVQEWDVTIEDQTHSWLIREASDADYSFTSYRKWTGVTSIAKAEKRVGTFVIEREKIRNDRFENVVYRAMRMKREYLSSGQGNKEDFLALFKEAETILRENYDYYYPAEKTVEMLLLLDTDKIKKKRRENANYLLGQIKNITCITPLFPYIDSLDVPLSVPVLFEDKNMRDKIRRYLIENQIYCPIHWPLSNLHRISERAKQIYMREISLICDQRYGLKDMHRQIEIVRSFCNGMRK